jgi:hypothetical protein
MKQLSDEDRREDIPRDMIKDFGSLVDQLGADR